MIAGMYLFLAQLGLTVPRLATVAVGKPQRDFHPRLADRTAFNWHIYQVYVIRDKCYASTC